MSKDLVIRKYEIRAADGNFIQAGETEDRQHVQVVISEISMENQRMITATVLLTREQWTTFCELRYSLTVDCPREEPKDAN